MSHDAHNEHGHDEYEEEGGPASKVETMTLAQILNDPKFVEFSIDSTIDQVRDAHDESDPKEKLKKMREVYKAFKDFGPKSLNFKIVAAFFTTDMNEMLGSAKAFSKLSESTRTTMKGKISKEEMYSLTATRGSHLSAKDQKALSDELIRRVLEGEAKSSYQLVEDIKVCNTKKDEIKTASDELDERLEKHGGARNVPRRQKLLEEASTIRAGFFSRAVGLFKGEGIRRTGEQKTTIQKLKAIDIRLVEVKKKLAEVTADAEALKKFKEEKAKLDSDRKEIRDLLDKEEEMRSARVAHLAEIIGEYLKEGRPGEAVAHYKRAEQANEELSTEDVNIETIAGADLDKLIEEMRAEVKTKVEKALADHKFTKSLPVDKLVKSMKEIAKIHPEYHEMVVEVLDEIVEGFSPDDYAIRSVVEEVVKQLQSEKPKS